MRPILWLDTRHRVAALFIRNGYIADVAKLATGTGLAQVFSILTVPVITRLYNPAEYGLVANYLALAGVIGAVAALRYELVIILQDTDHAASATVQLSVGLVMVITSMVALVLLMTDGLSFWPVSRSLQDVIFLLPVSIFLGATSDILINYANRKRLYTLLAGSRVWAALINPTVSVVAFCLLGSTAIGLILAPLCSTIATISVLSWRMSKQKLFPNICPVSADQLLAIVRTYRQFPIYNLALTLLDQTTAALPVLLFAALFSPTTAAYFALANTVLRLPIALVGRAVAQVFYERATRRKDQPVELRRLVLATIRALGLLGILPLGILMLFGPQLFSLIFGSTWTLAGEFARFLIIATTVILIASPISMTPSILNQQHWHLLLSLAAVGARLGALWLGAYLGSPLATVVLYSLGEASATLLFLGWLLRYLKRREQAVANQVLQAIEVL